MPAMVVLLIVVAALAAASLAAQLLLLSRKPAVDLSPLLSRLDAAERSSERLERSLRDDFARQREELRVQLASIRSTVDEQLQGTLERRLGESFNIVSERLELVHKGLGEMQSLAAGVGDLKKVLTNVKTRGTWGEVQLGNLL